MAFNPNELIIDRVRYVTAHDLETKEMLFMLTQLEDPSLNCTAEGEDVTDAVGALITTMYRSKQAEFTATNSLFSLDLAAAQYGTQKQVAGEGAGIVGWAYEFLDIDTAGETKELKQAPIEGSVQYVYAVENGAASTSYSLGSAASETEFFITGKEVTAPTNFTGKLFVEYQYETESGVRVVNSASEFPESCEVVIHCIFRNVCTDKVIAGQIFCPKAKLDPSSVEVALTATGKHPFTFKIQKDYCAIDEKLFEIIVVE